MMKNEEKKQSKCADAAEILVALERDLEAHIADLYGVKGCVQARHCYIYYRNQVSEAINILGRQS